MLFMLPINVAARVVESNDGEESHLSELAKQILAFFKFYNRGQCLLRFPAIIMPCVVGFDFMKNDSGGWRRANQPVSQKTSNVTLINSFEERKQRQELKLKTRLWRKYSRTILNGSQTSEVHHVPFPQTVLKTWISRNYTQQRVKIWMIS